MLSFSLCFRSAFLLYFSCILFYIARNDSLFDSIVDRYSRNLDTIKPKHNYTLNHLTHNKYVAQNDTTKSTIIGIQVRYVDF